MQLSFLRDKGASFPSIDDPEKVTTLKVWFCKFKSVREIARLTNLRVLVIAGFPDADLDAIGGLARLRYLRLLDLPKVTSLRPLATLAELASVSLATAPGWDASGRKSIVDSLSPLAELRALRHLELFGVVPQSGQLEELSACTWLESARISGYPESGIIRFRAATGAADRFNPEPEDLA
jgi:hypothetical protein